MTHGRLLKGPEELATDVTYILTVRDGSVFVVWHEPFVRTCFSLVSSGQE